MYHSCREKKELISHIIVTPIYDRLVAIRIKAKCYKIILIFAHALMKDKDSVVNDDLYTKLGDIYDKFPAKLVLRNFSAKVGYL